MTAIIYKPGRRREVDWANPLVRLTAAQQELAMSVFPLAIKLVRNAQPWLTRQEAESIAGEAVTKAAYTFDPALGRAMGTHAGWRVRGELGNFLRHELRAARATAFSQLDLKNRHDDYAGSGDGLPLAEVARAAPGAGAEEADEKRVRFRLLRRCRHLLPERWWRVLRMRYAEGMTLSQVGAAEGVTKERARQLINRALRAVRAGLGGASRPDVGVTP